MYSYIFFSWFFGAIKRVDAEKQLMELGNEHGSFLVRYSDSSPGKYVLSIRDAERVKHYKIHRHDDGGFFITQRATFATLPALIQHYEKEADGLCVNLNVPCLVSEKPQTAGLSKETNEVWEIDRKSICFVKKLGAGHFGEVWLGTWNRITEVAVKTLKPGIMEASEFLEEAALMKKLRHPNIMQLYAICTKEQPIYIITELMKHGSLKEYLRSDGHSLKLPQLINIGTQIASGMAYLEEKNYVHRNLAARNILVGDNLICKVADFGIARVIEEDMEDPSACKFPPIKWTAPEAEMYSRFTIKSDVWSFGILLYELITYGHSPYPGMIDAQVLEAVETGYRMSSPENCPELLYEIMTECWRDDAASRPTFETLQWRLEDFFFTDTGPIHVDPTTLL